MTVAIDSLAAMRKLEKAGFTTGKAEALVEVMAHTRERFATKLDLAEAVKAIRKELSVMRWIMGVHIFLTLALFGVVLNGFGFLS